LEKAGDIKLMINTIIQLVAWQYRWYSEFSPALLQAMRKLVEDEGAVKVRSIIQGTSLPENMLMLAHHYASLCAEFRNSGAGGEV